MSKDEIMEDLNEPVPEDPFFELIISMLRETYKENKNKKVKDPLIAALYETLAVVKRSDID